MKLSKKLKWKHQESNRVELNSSRYSVRKEKLQWISKQSNRLEWNSVKVLCCSENRENPSINSKCIDWNESSHSSPSNLYSTQPKHKHFARQQIHVCQQNVDWAQLDAHLFGYEWHSICIHAPDFSLLI